MEGFSKKSFHNLFLFFHKSYIHIMEKISASYGRIQKKFFHNLYMHFHKRYKYCNKSCTIHGKNRYKLWKDFRKNPSITCTYFFHDMYLFFMDIFRQVMEGFLKIPSITCTWIFHKRYTLYSYMEKTGTSYGRIWKNPSITCLYISIKCHAKLMNNKFIYTWKSSDLYLRTWIL